MLLFYFQIKPR